MHRLRRLHDSQYIMKNPFTNENSNLSNIFHNNIHRKKVESLKVRSTEEFLCQFAWLPCRFFRGRRQGRQPLIYIYICIRIYVKPFGTSALLCRIPVAYRVWWVNPRCLRSIPVSVGGDACACLLVEYHIYTVALLASNPQRNGDHPANIVS